MHRTRHALEAGLRCALFRHEGRNLYPTYAAQALAEVAREARLADQGQLHPIEASIAKAFSADAAMWAATAAVGYSTE